MRRISTSNALALSALLLVSICSAQQTSTTAVPNLIRYSGALKDAQGEVPFGTPLGVTFAIYKQQDGSAPVWQETQNVTPDASGQYSVILGSTAVTGLPGDLFSQREQRWLGVQVQGQAEQPRVLLVSVPYAFKAGEADKLAGHSASEFVTIDSLQNAVQQQLQSSGVSYPVVTTGNGKSARVMNQPGTPSGPTDFSGSTVDQIVGVTQSGTGTGVRSFAANNAVYAVASGTNGYAVHAITTGSGGIALEGLATGVGATIGLSAYAGSAQGVAGVFNNAAGGELLSGRNNGIETFSVDGSGNVNSTSGTYKIGGSSVLNIGSSADLNLFLGIGAGATNVAGYGIFNVFSGPQAGYYNTTGSNNVFFGSQAGYKNTTGYDNIFSGSQAGYYNTTGSNNTFCGTYAGLANATGSQNTFSGYQSGLRNTTGNDNSFLGEMAGSNNITGNSDIYIGNQGPLSGAESNTVRIGTQGAGLGQQNVAYIAGIYGSTSSSGIPVYINSDGQLGTMTSSLHFKEQVHDMGDSSSGLFQLRPVTFFYKPPYDDGSHLLQYGLIAEEVAKVYPDMVVYDKDGAPYTVKYQLLAPMLLNELQKQHHRAEAEAKLITAQEQKIDDLEQRLARLERLRGN